VEATENTIEAAAESLLAIETPEEEVETEVDAIAEDEQLEEAEVDDDGEEEPDEDETEDEGEPEELMFTVRVDGEDREVSEEELKRGYGGQAYIQKGMQETAEAKKQVEVVYHALQTDREQVAQLVAQLNQTGVMQAPVMPDVSMAQTDPHGYTQHFAEYTAQQQAYTTQQEQIRQVTDQQTATQKQAQNVYLSEQQSILEREIPDFADAEKGKQLKTDLHKAAIGYGFTSEQIAGISDAKTIMVLRDAMAYRALQNGKATAKAKKARPVVKTKAARKANPEAKAAISARDRFKKSGSLEDAADILLL
jgi:hypothetical protein